ncbi:MAG: helix-turn-helix transcriptional regulator [Clostridia bacterium]|nr:helix-turn-helix transcriptional regulator [Clostridia bacterium]
MTLEEIRPWVRNVTEANWKWNNRGYSMAYDCRVFCIREGEALLRTTTGELKLKKDAVCVFNTGIPYWFCRVADKSFDYICVNFDLTCAHANEPVVQPNHPEDYDPAKVIERIDFPELSAPIVIQGDSGLADGVAEVFEEFQNNRPHTRLRLSALMTDLLVRAIRASAGGSSRRARLADEVRSYIREHCREDVSNESVAAALGYHPNYLSRVFREATGITPHRWLIDCRLQAALGRLTSGGDTIESIAAEFGFSSPAHFTAAFKARYGRLPSDYRKDHMQI